MDLVLVGANHRTSTADVRASLAFDAEGIQRTLARVQADGILRESAILSTCNRTEFYGVADGADEGLEYLRRVIADYAHVDLGGGAASGYAFATADAALHLHRVAAGLDSMMLGEPQILGQVRDAHVAARQAATVGPILDRLWGSAVHAGKRARAESGIATGAVSVASAAVSLAERVFGSLAGREVLVVGAGDTGRLAARHFAERRVGRLVIANRTLDRASRLAEEFSGHAVEWSALPSALVSCDVVISGTSAPGVVITADMVRLAVSARPEKPLVLVDIAVPRDIDPGAANHENVFLYPLDALQTMVDQNLAKRQREVPRAEAIIRDECDRFVAWARSRGATPVVRELREQFERLRAEEVRKSLRHFNEADYLHVERLTRAIINRLLHGPTARLKTIDAASEGGAMSLEAVRHLFALEGESNGERKESEHGR